MKKIRPILLLTCILMAFSGCEKIDTEKGEETEQPGGQIPGEGDTGEGGNPDGGEEGGEASGGLPVAGYPAGAFTVSSLNNEGISYMWDESVIPEITIHITPEEWNKLLARYDEYQHNVDYFHADFTYKKGEEVIFI